MSDALYAARTGVKSTSEEGYLARPDSGHVSISFYEHGVTHAITSSLSPERARRLAERLTELREEQERVEAEERAQRELAEHAAIIRAPYVGDLNFDGPRRSLQERTHTNAGRL